MSQLEDAIAEIADPKVRERVDAAVAELKQGRRYGLVFENHFSTEMVVLPGLPIRVGSAVTLRTEPENGVRYYEVVRLEGEDAALVAVGGSDERVVPQWDLLVVKPFEDPIYPGLTHVGGVGRGGPDKPAHMVWSAENFHALQLLLFTHMGKVDVIYIDPPYNTGARDWKYNNRFVDDNDTWRHSKWLSMMEKRLKLASKLLRPDGVLIVTIDEHEVHRLGVLLEQLFPDSYRQMVTIVITARGVAKQGLARVEEYAQYVYFGNASASLTMDDYLSTEGGKVRTRSPWASLLRRGTNALPSDRPGLVYPILIDPDTDRISGVGETLADRVSSGELDLGDLNSLEPVRIRSEAWPTRSDGSLGTWQVRPSTLRELMAAGFVKLGRFNETRQSWTVNYLKAGPRKAVEAGELLLKGYEWPGGPAILEYKDTAEDLRRAKTVWRRTAHDAGTHGSQLLRGFLGARAFDFPKSLYSTADTLATVVSYKPNALILDFFAGSGTTLHATALLNARDGGSRQCILVTNNDVSDAEARALIKEGHYQGDREYEAAGIFESVTKPRVEAALTGVRPDGKSAKGSYLSQYLKDRSYADGFEENVEFFRIDYLDPDVVSLGRQYDAIAPLLWSAAGCIGDWESRDVDVSWSAPKTSAYAILFEEDAIVDFGTYLRDRPEITHVWLVTNSALSFADMRAELSDDLSVGMLYRDYLRNFEINTAEALR